MHSDMIAEFDEVRDTLRISAEATAILMLAAAVRDFWNPTAGHEICMGIRHGLFGAQAGKDARLWPRVAGE